jgi:hypothetical protein
MAGNTFKKYGGELWPEVEVSVVRSRVGNYRRYQRGMVSVGIDVLSSLQNHDELLVLVSALKTEYESSLGKIDLGVTVLMLCKAQFLNLWGT